jgi:hypothetical protein
LVGLTGSAWPDIIGGLIAVIFLRSAWRVLGKLAGMACREGTGSRYCNDMETSPW